MRRIVIGGFLHETNTFAPSKASYQGFVQGSGHSAMATGAAVLDRMHNVNIATSGFLRFANSRGWQVVPTIWCAASPSAHVERDAYERIANCILEGIAENSPIDGVYLD